jgi:hypothetical protein
VPQLVSALRSGSLPFWFSTLVLTLAILAAAAMFLWPTALEFPMDDTYIHFVYAQNLVDHGKLFFSYPDEQGVGTSSLLWTLLLAGGRILGLSMHLAAKTLGVASLLVVSIGVYELMRPVVQPVPALAGALLVGLSGNMLWFTLSGMETTLFVALGVLALLAYRRERWVWLGVLLGLLTLARPEGLALLAAIGGVELWRARRLHRGIVLAGLICALICGPWFGYLLWRTGHVLPTSAVGKQLTSTMGIRIVAGRSGPLAVLARLPGLVYPFLWLAYLAEFTLGGMAMPPPRVSAGAVGSNTGYAVSVWAVAGWIIVILPLLWMATRRMGRLRRWPAWTADPMLRPMLVLAGWVILHNLSYMLFLPVPGTASRYGALNHVALWLTLTIGLVGLYRSSRLWPWAAAGLALIAGANTIYWNGVYDANLEHMQRVRIAAAYFVRDHLADERCAVMDIGAIRYFGERPIVDLGGLVDPNAGRWFLEGASDRYLVQHQVTCLVLPGRSGASDEGWFDLAAIMGLTTTPMFRMETVAVFEIDHDRWLQGYLPTNNYQATVAIYRLVAAAQ